MLEAYKPGSTWSVLKMSATRNTLPLTLIILWIMQRAILVAAVPLTNTIAGDTAMYDPDLFEGDIVITPEEFEKYYGVPHSEQSGKVSNPLSSYNNNYYTCNRKLEHVEHLL